MQHPIRMCVQQTHGGLGPLESGKASLSLSYQTQFCAAVIEKEWGRMRRPDSYFYFPGWICLLTLTLAYSSHKVSPFFIAQKESWIQPRWRRMQEQVVLLSCHSGVFKMNGCEIDLWYGKKRWDLVCLIPSLRVNSACFKVPKLGETGKTMERKGSQHCTVSNNWCFKAADALSSLLRIFTCPPISRQCAI